MTDSPLKYRRVLLKLSGEALMGDEDYGIDPKVIKSMAAEIIEALKGIGSGGTTIVLATHQARLAAALKRRTLTLDGGHVVKDQG